MTTTAADVHDRLNTDLEFFALHASMMIKDKEGHLIRWGFNIAQKYIHHCIEKQLKEKGWVRALILKGRQQGCSTYVNGRFYHKTRSKPGISTFILSHEGGSTDTLFNIVKRYHDNVSPPIQAHVGRSNRREMEFDVLGSDYAAATAKNDQTGRSRTAQLFHGSEVGYWEYGYAIQDGALKIVSLVPGTEIILESTANGPLGLFYDKCMKALRGDGDYILIFVPWYWQDEYERDPDFGFELTDEEEKFVEAHFSKPFPFCPTPIPRTKTLRKMAWRRAEIEELSTGDNIESGRAKFRTIFPSNPIEAFQASGVGLFRPDAITAARKNQVQDNIAARIAGVDPAGDSDNSDRTVISIRQGRRIERRIKFKRMRPMELAGIIAKLMDTEHLDMVFIDRGYGEGTIDRLREMGYGSKVVGVAFNERTLEPDRFQNKRSEMIINYSVWLNAGDVRIPDDDDGHAALACIPLDEETSNGLKFIKSKREIKKSLGGAKLLDLVDADALTFAYPVRTNYAMSVRKVDDVKSASKGGGPLKSLARMRRKR